MNIDQHLEALTQTVELLAATQQDNEKRWENRWGEISTALQQCAISNESVRSRAKRLKGLFVLAVEFVAVAAPFHNPARAIRRASGASTTKSGILWSWG